MSTKHKAMLSVLSVAAAGMLAGCSTTTNSTATTSTANHQPREGGSIQLDSFSGPQNLDPAKAFDGVSEEVVLEMYNQLVTYKGSTSDIVPSVAKSWTVSPDGKTYTFNLRNAKFWNGDPVTAQSFIDEFERVLNPKTASPGEGYIDPIVVGSTAYHQGKATQISGMAAPNSQTLVIHLTEAEPFFPEILAMPIFSAVDQKYINQVGDDAFNSRSPMGSGPFKLSKISPNEVILAKNASYWQKDSHGNQLPYLNQVTININSNAQLDGMRFENGTTALFGQLTDGIPSAAYNDFLTNSKLKSDVVRNARNATFYLGLNVKMAPFNNPKVRQAAEYAIDKNQVIKLINGRGITANQPLPPGIQGYSHSLAADATYKYNQAKAKQLLKEAGYNGTPVTLYTYNDPDMVKILTAIQNDLTQVGFKVQMKPLALASYMTLNTSGKTQAFLTDWGQDYPDASDFLDSLFNTNQQPANNSTLYSNKQVDTWLNEAQTDTNQTQRLALYQQVTNQVMKDAVIVPLYYSVRTDAVQSWVHGYYVSPSLRDPLQYLWIDQNH